MAQSGIRWIKPPKQMAANLQKYGDQHKKAVHAVGVQVGQKMQNEARQNAPWQDRTGNARGGLFFAVDGLGQGTVEGKGAVRSAEGTFSAGASMRAGGELAAGPKELIIVLGHTMWYGSSLELDHGGRYAIVLRTIDQNVAVLRAMLNELGRD